MSAAERINNLVYTKNPDGTDGDRDSLFFDGPGEFVAKVVAQLLSKDPLWPQFFGEFIDPYRRMDYPIRGLPALRIYTNGDTKEFESWFVEGDLKMDVIFPASIRRNETQQLQDTLSAALLQQFRRPQFFDAANALIPGLNELGKRYVSDKSLGFSWNEEMVPLTQLTVNYKIDLRKWDDYLEASNRTKDSPFSPVLADLKRIVSQIQALRDDGSADVVTSVNEVISSAPQGPQTF